MHKPLLMSSMALALLVSAAPAGADNLNSRDGSQIGSEQQRGDRQSKKSDRSDRKDRARAKRDRSGDRGQNRSISRSDRTERAERVETRNVSRSDTARRDQIERIRDRGQLQRRSDAQQTARGKAEWGRDQLSRAGGREDRNVIRDRNPVTERTRSDRIEDRIRDVRQDAYRDGRQDGSRDGRRDGRNDGYRDGRRDGHHDGYRDGRRDGRHDGYRDGRREHRDWSNHWRSDRRYNWRDYRKRNRIVFRLGSYYDPFGWNYRRYGVGSYMRNAYYRDSYWISDPWRYRLPPVYGPYKWVRYYDDALLVDIYNGRVVDVLYDFFW